MRSACRYWHYQSAAAPPCEALLSRQPRRAEVPASSHAGELTTSVLVERRSVPCPSCPARAGHGSVGSIPCPPAAALHSAAAAGTAAGGSWPRSGATGGRSMQQYWKVKTRPVSFQCRVSWPSCNPCGPCCPHSRRDALARVCLARPRTYW